MFFDFIHQLLPAAAVGAPMLVDAVIFDWLDEIIEQPPLLTFLLCSLSCLLSAASSIAVAAICSIAGLALLLELHLPLHVTQSQLHLLCNSMKIEGESESFIICMEKFTGIAASMPCNHLLHGK